MAVSVDPFSFAMVELSEEYINAFPQPDTVLKYLDNIVIGHITGVELMRDHDLNIVSLKGSWMSVSKTHSLLTGFLLSYQAEKQSQEPKAFHAELNSNNLSDSEGEGHNSSFDSSFASDKESKFYDGSGKPSGWVRWTAEILPRIHNARSRQAAAVSKGKASSSLDVPEPQILYASFEPTRDPSVEKPSLHAIEKVLKEVYNKDKEESTAEEDEDAVCSDEQEDAAVESLVSRVTRFVPNADMNADLVRSDLNPTFYTSNKETSQSSYHNLLADIKPVSFSGKEAAESQNDQFSGETDVDNRQKNRTKEVEDKSSERKQSKNDLRQRRAKKIEPVNKKSSEASSSKKTAVHEALTESDKQVKSEKKKKGGSKNRKTSPCVVKTEHDAEQEVYPTRTSGRLPARAKSRRKTLRKEVDNDTSTAGMTLDLLDQHEHEQEDKKVTNVAKNPVQTRKQKTDFHCDQCQYVAKQKSHLREHKRRMHITKRYGCTECGKVFGYGKDLKRHLQTHQKAEHCCDVCGKVYKEVRTLAEHRKIHEDDYVKPEWPCKFCEKVFSTKYLLAYHIKSEHLGLKKTYICPTCGKSFSQKNSYQQHANVHMGIRPYRCHVCGKSFSYEKSLKEHSYVHAEGKQFECEICNKKFRQSSGIAIHMKTHKEQKDYVCSHCGKGFSQKQAMVRHERIHAGDKPFCCELCKRTFTDSSTMRRHMILIHKKDPKNWKEDTLSNVQRKTDFFIAVVDKDGKPTKKRSSSKQSANSDAQVNDVHSHGAEINSGGLASSSRFASDHSLVDSNNSTFGDDPEQSDIHMDGSAEDSFTFIPVGIGPSRPPILRMQATTSHRIHTDGHFVPALETMQMLTPDTQVHIPGASSTSSPGLHTKMASGPHADSSAFTVTAESSVSSQMDLQATGLVTTAFPFHHPADHHSIDHLHPPPNFLSNDLSVHPSDAAGSSTLQHHPSPLVCSTILAALGNAGYHHHQQQGLVMLSDSLGSLAFHTEQQTPPTSDVHSVNYDESMGPPEHHDQQQPFTDDS